MRLDARHIGRHSKTEIGIGLEIGLAERTVKGGAQETARHADRHPAADAVFSAGPTGVDQPAIDMMLGDEIAQQIAIDRGMRGHERRTKTRRERRFRVFQATLGAGHLGCVAREEVIHGLRWIKLGNRRQHAPGIAGQHDDILGNAGTACHRGIGDEIHRIGAARVLGLGAIIEIRHPGDRIDRDILEQRAEPLCRGINLRLRLGREANGLGIAATFKIEDTGWRPAMLIVTQQNALRISRKRGLAGA